MASRSVPKDPVITTSWNSPTASSRRDRDDAVDLGCLVDAARVAGAVDEHGPSLPDERVARAARDGVLQLAALREPLERERRRAPGRRMRDRGRALLGGEGEEPRPVELGLLEERDESALVLLGLTGVPEDERRAEGRGRLERRIRSMRVEEPLRLAPPPHRPQQRARRVLEREVEVRHAASRGPRR